MKRKISAHFLCTLNGDPIKFGTVVINELNYILEIIEPHLNFIETENTEFYNGILVPRLINILSSYPIPTDVLLPEDFTTIDIRNIENRTIIVCPSFLEKSKFPCPNPLFLEKQKNTIVIGSYFMSKNTEQNILSEIKILAQKFNIPFIKLLAWSTLNPALTLGLNGKGALFIDTSPGISLISGFDFTTFNITSKSNIRNLVQ